MPINVSQRSVTVTEGQSATYSVRVTDARGMPFNGTLLWQVSPGGMPSASSLDFSSMSGRAYVTNGFATVSIATKVDTLKESDERFSVLFTVPGTMWSDVVGGTIKDGTAVTPPPGPSPTPTPTPTPTPPPSPITDPFVMISTADTHILEGDTGTTACKFTVSLSGFITKPVTVVSYEVRGGTAQADDFIGGTFPKGTITFEGRELKKDLIINIAGDKIVEGDESFTVVLTSVTSGARLSSEGPNSRSMSIRNDDSFAATNGSDTYLGTVNDDQYDGLGGNDNIRGVAGNDTLNGGAGDDTIDGGAGHDVINGGDGFDTVSYVAAGSAIIMYGGQATSTVSVTEGNDTFSSIEKIVGGSFNDYLNLWTPAGAMFLDGGSGNDTLNGWHGNDTQIGGTGNDNLAGGRGVDLMTGGIGNDTFVFYTIEEMTLDEASCDTITDFQTGIDKIDLSVIDASVILAGNNAFVWRGTSGITNSTSGEIAVRRVDNVGTANDYTLLIIDTDSDVQAEGLIKISGLPPIAQADFVQ